MIEGIPWAGVVGALSTAGSLVYYFIKLKRGSNVEDAFVNRVLRNKPRMTKWAWRAHIAEVAVLLAQYIDCDLVDSQPDGLARLKHFLVSNMPNEEGAKQ